MWSNEQIYLPLVSIYNMTISCFLTCISFQWVKALLQICYSFSIAMFLFSLSRSTLQQLPEHHVSLTNVCLSGQQVFSSLLIYSPGLRNVSQVCLPLPFALCGILAKCTLWGSICGAVMKVSSGKAGSWALCWMRGLKDHTSMLESGVPTLRWWPQGKTLHMKVQGNRSYLYFRSVSEM